MTDERSRKDAVEYLSRARDAAFIGAIYVFFAGFTYRHYYLEHFAIGGSGVDESPPDTCAYAYTVVTDNLQWFILAGLFVALMWFLAWFCNVPAVPVVIVLVAFGATGFFLIDRAAYSAALMESTAVRGHSDPDYTLEIDISAAGRQLLGKDLLNAASSNGLRLLSKTSTDYYFLRQPLSRRGTDTELPRGFVYTIPRSYVIDIKTVLPGKD
jgi:hypothetical protein